MNKLLALAAGLCLATTVLSANAAQPRHKSQQDQQARANIEQNYNGAEQAHWKHRRDRDDYYWDDGYWDNGRWYPYHNHRHHRHHHHRHHGGSGFVVEFP